MKLGWLILAVAAVLVAGCSSGDVDPNQAQKSYEENAAKGRALDEKAGIAPDTGDPQ